MAIKLECESKEWRDVFSVLLKDGVVKNNDRKMSCEGIADVLFDNYQEYPELIKEMSGSLPSWTITDKEALKKLDSAISLLRAILTGNGLKNGTGEFDERLAVGLFYLAYVPLKSEFDAGSKDSWAWNNMSQDLYLNGLDDFAEWLEANGGFGLSTIKEDADIETDADTVIRDHKGFCTERSKVVFAFFEHAGLKPFMESLSAMDVEKAWSEFWHYKVPLVEGLLAVQFMGHAIVGLRSKNGRVRHFDPTMSWKGRASDAPFGRYAQRRSLRQFRMFENMNLLDDVAKKISKAVEEWRDPSEYIRPIENLYQKTRMLGNSNFEMGCAYYINAANALYSAKRTEEALKIFDDGEKDCRTEPLYFVKRAALGDPTDNEKMVADLKEALKLDKDNIAANIMMGDLLNNKHKPEEAMAYFEHAFAVDKSDVNVLSRAAVTALYSGNREKAIALLRKGAEIQPANPQINMNLGLFSIEDGKLDEVFRYLSKAFAVNGNDPEINGNMAILSGLRNNDEDVLFWLKRRFELDPKTEDHVTGLLALYNKRKMWGKSVETYDGFIDANKVSKLAFQGPFVFEDHVLPKEFTRSILTELLRFDALWHLHSDEGTRGDIAKGVEGIRQHMQDHQSNGEAADHEKFKKGLDMLSPEFINSKEFAPLSGF
ncbi:MAG: hypothetical protein COV46_00605 [Deltaproteobacteria bacterium CG11_big_fil_rev_8_21_14_0_20_49_13]|nr:MAG: hypothetical protein COV46_00605 [Deltaproteobacteria bacterium CG11_big_fil_rev_8_21_14_0_20_49_13]